MKGRLQKGKRLRRIALRGGIVLVLAACEKPFEPIQANDYVFSIYGHLEATADTQWVRVTPIRTTLATAPGPIDAVVSLQEVETGTTVVMSDSLGRYLPVNLGGDELYAHNFFTTMPMVPGRHYRLTAARSDGATASATVLIPVIQDPVLEISTDYYPGLPLELRPPRGEIHGMRYLAMIIGLEDIADGCPAPIRVHQEYLRTLRHGQADGEPHFGLLEWIDAGEKRAWEPIELRPSHIQPGPSCTRARKRIVVVASGVSWPQGELTSDRDLSRPNLVSNIEGGVGFLAGVHTHVFPFERCIPLTSNGRCRITYSATSATVVGFVTNFCDGAPVSGAIVALRGLDAAGFRSDTTSLAGQFEFQGLDPDVSHSITVSHSAHEAHQWESLTFAQAAVDTVAAAMRPEGGDPCAVVG